MTHLDYNLRITKSAPFSDKEEWSLYQRGLLVGKTTWRYVKEFRDYYGIIDAGTVVETWKRENGLTRYAGDTAPMD